MYTKAFEIRWNDIDANMHLGNSAYIEFMSHTRMSFFTENGMGLDVMLKYALGPIVLYEHIYYFKEVNLGRPIKVSLEVFGYTENCQFVLFHHNFYNQEGKNLAHAEMLFSFINMNTRKLGEMPIEISNKIKGFPKSNNFKILTREDIQKYRKHPVDLS